VLSGGLASALGGPSQKTVFTAEDLPSFRKLPVTPSGGSKPVSHTSSPTADAPIGIKNSSSKNSSLSAAGNSGGHTHGHTSNCYCGAGGKKDGASESK
jgi:hypothetical protein